MPCLDVQAEGIQFNPRFKQYLRDQKYLEHMKSEECIFKSFLLWTWWLTSNCGRSMKRWVFWSVEIAVTFAFIFLGIKEDIIVNPQLELAKDDFRTYLYYSAVTFTTLGFGDVTPKTPLASILVTLEVILGYIMLGGLISILANKLARRA
jgi:hypothetical protein